MTINQYRAKAEAARKHGAAVLPGGGTLHCYRPYYPSDYRMSWSLTAKDGNTIDTAYNPSKFEYICDDYDWRA